jgi:hypothetical protein
MEIKAKVPRASPLTTQEDANLLANPTLSDLIRIFWNFIFVLYDDFIDYIKVFHLFFKLKLYIKAHVASLLQSCLCINYMFFDVKCYIYELITRLQRDSIITCMFPKFRLDI